MRLLWRRLHSFHFLDYFHFLKFFQFLYLLLHYLSYRLHVLHNHIVVPLQKYLRPGNVQQVRNLIAMRENGLRIIMVLNKTSMVLINKANGSWELPLVVSLHLDVRRRRIFLACNNSSSYSLRISSDVWNCTPTNSWSNMERRGKPRRKWLNGLGLLS